ncbi:MAG: peptidylprolyl isomerase [Clostridia bacterium]|nr:peptidylprolyl isomerase [Clostridia bacterium]
MKEFFTMAHTKNKTLPRQTLILIISAVMLLAGLCVFFLTRSNASDASATTLTRTGDMTPTHTAVIEIENYGTLKAELYGHVAPITVENFVKLSNDGFYDGLTFHRIIAGFMMQGGCPLGTGTGGADKDIKGEFSQNGIPNAIKHEKGVLSMARSALPNSASSQFFIMHQAAPYLDGSYAAFGRVTEGLDVVDAVCENAVGGDGNGVLPKANQPVIRSIRCTAVQ